MSGQSKARKDDHYLDDIDYKNYSNETYDNILIIEHLFKLFFANAYI